MFIVLLSWQGHCESSFDEYADLAPSSCQPSDQTN